MKLTARLTDDIKDFSSNSEQNNVPDYEYREVSKIILNNILSLTEKINRYTWRKYL